MTCENYAQYLFELNNTRSDHPALIDECNVLTYAQMEARVRSFASVLRTYNFAPQSRVILYFDDCVEWPVAFLALIAVGLNPVCVNHNNTPDRLDYLLDLVDARAVITNKIITLKKSIAMIDASQILQHPSSDFFNFYQFHPDEPCFWLLTSGTTGHPKAIVHRHSNLYNYLTTAKSTWQIDQNSRVFSTAKLSFTYGLNVALTMSLPFGATVCLMSGIPGPKRIFDYFQRHNVTHFYTVPTVINSILKHNKDQAWPESVKEIVSAGESLPPVISKKFRTMFGISIRNSLGMSETTAMYLAQSSENYEDGSLGMPLPKVQCRLLDEHSNQVNDGEVGEMHVKSPCTATLYWKDWKYTKHTFVGDWVRTGDLMVKLPSGYQYVSRADDQIKINGQFVSSVELEASVLEYPNITDCVVVFKILEDAMPEIHAFIVTDDQHVDKKRHHGLLGWIVTGLQNTPTLSFC
jgi:benzoate-CoA ligase